MEFLLEIEASASFSADDPTLEVLLDGVVVSSDLITAQSGSGVTILQYQLSFSGAYPSSLDLRFNDASSENGRTIEIEALRVNGQNVTSFLNVTTLNKNDSAELDTDSIDFIFGEEQPDYADLDTITHSGTGAGEKISGNGLERDVIDAGGGDDELHGEQGDDQLWGGAGDDDIRGDIGNDLLIGDAGNDKIKGEQGNDALYGGDGLDQLRGGDGNDLLSGNADMDRIFGGAGDDLIYGGTGNDILFGEAGANTIYGGDGEDFITGGNDDDVIYGDAGIDILKGADGNDTLSGGDDDDRLHGHDGDDTLNGDAGIDLLEGGAGDDVLNGGDGNDRLEGGDDDDTLNGGDGNDNLRGDGGNDTLNGDTGNDVLGGFAGTDTLNGGDGSDRLYGGDGNDILNGDNNNDRLYGGSGNDTLNGGAGRDQLFSGDQLGIRITDASDLLSYGGSSQDKGGVINVMDDGVGFELDGNLWKRVLVDYTITADTVLEFDFRSTNQPEINGIGFDNDNGISSGLTFQVWGTQNWGISNFNNYDGSGDWIHYEINVGAFYTGTFSHLFFVNDDDGSGDDGEGYWRNIVIHEGGETGGTLNGDEGFDKLYGDGGADTFVFDSSDVFNKTDIVNYFNEQDGDALDISDLLSGFNPGSSDINDFVQLSNSGDHSILSVDTDGVGGDFQVVAEIRGVTDMDVDTLYGNSQIIV